MQRALIILIFLGAVAAASAGVWRYGYLQALDQLARQGQGDLALASDRLVGQLRRFGELAVILADHPQSAELAEGRGSEAARLLYLDVADKTDALDVLFVDVAGRVQASARGPVGGDLSDTDYVKRAQKGALGWGHGISKPLAQRAFYYAAPSFGASGKVNGAVVVAAGMDGIEDAWRGGLRAVFFTDARGQVFVTNRSELVLWQRAAGGPGLAPPEGDVPPFASYETGGHEIWQLGWGPYLPQNALHLVRPLPVIGLTGEVLMDVAPARQLAKLQATVVAALCLAFGALLFLATERRRTLARANADLEERVARRTTALSEINMALRQEVSERKDAETALARAQADLVQAGKLSALGKMSAGISHELNQPLMAIRSFAENAALFLERGKPERAAENLGRISDMARRMGRIIKNLRAFSTQQTEPVTRVDLVAVLDSAVEMISARARTMGIVLDYKRVPHPIWVQGGEVRLGQVFVNLMTNALDAMNGSDAGVLTLRVTQGETLVVDVCDTGPGVADPAKVFDPFYSTKEVGASEGMGLGLSISYGIMQSFGGEIRVRNTHPGAVFSVEIQPWEAREAA
ncbi:sensor histidine kinase [Roseobacter sp. YSTF-M11]|uniref:C4-dicarboxylate transport sensor protein DctB n=1 Tax=Roseobacter insulae TaxID=2859783 RepID=A0A9X1JYT4_9RHOB|nr:ATP-binding protein [Roseobacter insulae]MBW4708601.1 sensor histidine kinase [Roseobacter insulae]